MTPSENLALAMEVRPANEGDTNFILNSWLRSYHETSTDVAEGRISGAVYWAEHNSVAKRLLEKSGAVVAYKAEAPEVILGWACVQDVAGQQVLHYLYVKHHYRPYDVEGFLAACFPECRWYTHRTRRLDVLARKLGLTFNPYLAGVSP